MEINQCLVNDYMGAYKNSSNYDKRLQFLKDFIKDEDCFEPTRQAKKNAVCDFVLRNGDVNPYSLTYEEMDEKIKESFDSGKIRNLRQSVNYQYSSTAGRECAVHTIYADVLIDGKYEKCVSGGIAFSLESFVKRKEI
jgi:hypothetical protein